MSVRLCVGVCALLCICVHVYVQGYVYACVFVIWGEGPVRLSHSDPFILLFPW